MKIYFKLLAIAIAAFISDRSFAQSKKNNTLQLPPKEIKVDGLLTDWGDSLRYYNQEKKLNYSLANNKDNLYIAMRINDRSEQMRILHSGLMVSINTKGKKKETYSITFPVGGNDDQSLADNALASARQSAITDDRDEMMRARLTRLRNIKVSGFPDIESDMITTANTYGIQVALQYTDDGYLDYEAAIPLKFFHADDIAKTEWAFNFKINGITRSADREGASNSDSPMGGRGGMGGGRGGMGGGMRGGMGGGRGGMRGGGMQGRSQSADRSEVSKSVDFWEKYYLSPGN